MYFLDFYFLISNLNSKIQPGQFRLNSTNLLTLVPEWCLLDMRVRVVAGHSDGERCKSSRQVQCLREAHP
jgi:hypothetical protein